MRSMKLKMLVCVLLIGSAEASKNNLWTNFQGDTQHTGYANVVVNPKNLRILWKHNVASASEYFAEISTLVATNEGIYFTVNHEVTGVTNIKKLVALNPNNGETRWMVDSKHGTSPAYDNGKIYTLNDEEPTAYQRLSALNLNAYDQLTGQLLSANRILIAGDKWYKQTPVIDNDQIFLGSSYVQYALNAKTGQLVWKSGDVDGFDDTASLSDKYLMRVMFNALAVLDRQTGSLVASIEGADSAGCCSARYPVIFDEKSETAFTQFVQNRHLQVTAFDIKNKKIKWKLPLNSQLSNMALADDTLFFIERNHDLTGKDPQRIQERVMAINIADGEVVWMWTPIQPLTGQIIATPNVLIIGAQKLIYIVSRETHELVGLIPTAYTDNMAVAGNVLYVASKHYLKNHPASITAIQLN